MRSIEIPQPEDRGFKYRCFEVLPGLLTWLILFLPVWLSLVSVKLAAYFIIGYLLVWFIRAIGLNVRSLQGWHQINEHKRAPWQDMNSDLEDLVIKTKNAPVWHAENLQRVETYMLHKRLKPSEVVHAVIVAAYNEPIEIIEPTIKSILACDIDVKNMILIFAYEARNGAQSEQACKEMIKKYGAKFKYAAAIKHPANMPGEVIGKGGNITYAGYRLKEYLEKVKINPARVIVTTLDSDNRPDKQYFAALSYTFCSTEDPKHSSYQPVPMYTNNIWDAPAPMRVIATGNSFWNIVLAMRTHMLRNFSSHAQPMEALIDTDFWSVRTIVEDGHQYWRTWFRYDGRHEVYPIYVPIYQDAVLSFNYKKTIKAQFIQIRRWAWGASDVAYVAHMGFLKPNKIPKHKVAAKFFRLLEGHVSWSTAPLLITGAGFVPFLLNPDSYVANQVPQLISRLQTVAMVGIILSLFLSFQSLPPKPERYKRHRTLWMVLQWVYLPFTTIIFNACAAIYSQTRLMFGRYLGEFDVTDKAVVKD
jgi:cellulose synthase/poly-beta-1,6-N-acetylglucosamine synthase-like glycosyltransferase